MCKKKPMRRSGRNARSNLGTSCNLVVVNPYRCPWCSNLGCGFGVTPIHRSIGVPPRSFEGRGADRVVIERPERRIGEAEVEIPVLLVVQVPRLELDAVVRRRHCGGIGPPRPADPDPPTLPQNGQKSRHQPAGA